GAAGGAGGHASVGASEARRKTGLRIVILSGAPQALDGRIDQCASDAHRTGKLRQRVEREPARIDDLLVAGPNLAACVPGGVGDHQRMREGPRLARHVAQTMDLDPDFLAHFAMDAILDRFACFDESGQRAVERLRKALRARQQELLPAGHERHHRRRHAWVDDMATSGTLLGALLDPVARRRAAAPAKPVAAVPFEDLRGTAGKREPWVGNLQEEAAQTPPFPPFFDFRVGRRADGEAIHTLEAAEIMPAAVDRQPQYVT